MSFGKSFHTLKEANAYLKKVKVKWAYSDIGVRKMNKKLFPRRKKLYHVGTYIEFINFA